MANPSTANTTPASTPADQTARRWVEQATALWIASGETALQLAFDAHNAALADTQAWTTSASTLTQDALRRWSDLSRQAQQATLKTYQATAHLVDELVPNSR
jgi:prephenate dehydrogenase